MLIDWFTVAAQAVNFLILVWLLKRFLYRPILDALDLRENNLAIKLAGADRIKAEAQQEYALYQQKNEEFELQRATLMEQTRAECKALRQRLLDEARKAADALSARQQETLRCDLHKLNQTIVQKTQLEVFDIARKTLGELACASLEEQICRVFVQRLKNMDSKAHATFAAALGTASAAVRVQSAFELPESGRAAIQSALQQTFPDSVLQLGFETGPELIAGIELYANGQKLSWSIADYLQSLEKCAVLLVDEKFQPDERR